MRLSASVLGTLVGAVLLLGACHPAHAVYELQELAWEPTNGTRTAYNGGGSPSQWATSGSSSLDLNAVLGTWNPSSPPSAATGYLSAAGTASAGGGIPSGAGANGMIAGALYTRWHWGGPGSAPADVWRLTAVITGSGGASINSSTGPVAAGASSIAGAYSRTTSVSSSNLSDSYSEVLAAGVEVIGPTQDPDPDGSTGTVKAGVTAQVGVNFGLLAASAYSNTSVVVDWHIAP